MQPRIKICFVGLMAYPVFNPEVNRVFGGTEVQSYLLSTGLAQIDSFDVSYLVGEQPQLKQKKYNGVQIYAHSTYRRDAGFLTRYNERLKEDIFQDVVPGWHRRFPFVQLRNNNPVTLFKFGLWILLAIYSKIDQGLLQKPRKFWGYRKIGADVYCVLGVSGVAAEVAAYCKRTGKKFLLCIADDPDLDEKYRPDAVGVNHYNVPYSLCYYAIANANFIVSQTEYQKARLKEVFKRDSQIVQYGINLDDYVPDVTDYRERKIALWVGRADRFKKMPMRLIDLAKLCLDVQFKMVINDQDENLELAAEIKREKPPNVEILDGVPFQEIERLFAEAFVLVTTSEFEGFPNTFLQAGKYGVPILSYKVDPDHFIEKYQCGIVTHSDFDKLVEGLYTIKADKTTKQYYSKNIKAYVQQHHNMSSKVQEFAHIIQSLME